MKRLFSTGNVLVEYALPIALIGIACIGALTLIGSTSSDFISGMSKQMGDGKTVQLAADSSAIQSQSSQAGENQNTTGNAISNIEVAFLPSDTTKSIDTTGSNGTTEILATQLSTFTQESLAKKEINQEQANQLQDLANQGFRLGQIEAAVETAFANNQGSVEFEGKKYSVYDLAHTLNAYDEDSGITLTPTNTRNLDADHVGSELKSFLTTYNEVKNSGALSNSKVNTTVTGLTAQISTISDNMAESIFRLTQTDEKSSVSQLNNNEARTEYLQGITTGLFNSFYNLPKNAKNSSTVTNQASSTICATGAKNYGQSKKNNCS